MKWISHSSTEFHHFDPQEAAEIRRALLDWYHENRRKLPWRGDPPPYEGSTAGINTNGNDKSSKKKASIPKDYNSISSTTPPKTAYGIWVSEIMLQQTRVEAVIPYWLAWMQAFPSVQALADATEEQVNSKWAGLGFYRRARLLHEGAKYIVEHHNGEVPGTPDQLQKIPGIGPYTAAAIASIAFGVQVAVVDGNVCRVLSRLRGIAQHIKAPVFKDKYARDIAQQIVSAAADDDTACNAGDVNQAMMELGATYCAPSGTGIDPKDPLQEFYYSTKLGAAYYQHVVLSETKNSGTQEQIQQLLMDVDKPQITTATTTIMESATAKKKKTIKNQAELSSSSSSCAVCDQLGVQTVLEQLADAIEAQGDHHGATAMLGIARKCGHSVFPMAPPKQTKREEVLAVAVLSTTTTTSANGNYNHETYWLLVKRPKKGLLAGQWEFPSVCVWNSDNNKSNSDSKTKKSVIDVPLVKPAVRQKALTDYLLEEILSPNAPVHDTLKETKRANLKTTTKGGSSSAPIEHIFSHVRHTMWIEHATLMWNNGNAMEWTSQSTGQDVRWMRESDMDQAGVTSGVKKILKAVQAEQKTSQKKNGFFAAKSKAKPKK